jgi:DNA end-binding protein Ku
MTEDFDPSKYKDDYREALTKVIEAKLEGKELVGAEAPPPESNVLELMDALRASMENIKARKEKGKSSTASGANSEKVVPAKGKKRSAASAG